jgi:hypothetical protein
VITDPRVAASRSGTGGAQDRDSGRPGVSAPSNSLVVTGEFDAARPGVTDVATAPGQAPDGGTTGHPAPM